MVAGKDYILMTDSTTHPDGFPAIGSIIRDSLRPKERALSISSHAADVLTNSATYRAVTSSDFNAQGNIWVRFCQSIEVGLGDNKHRDIFNSYATRQLDTISMRQLPSKEEVSARAQEPEVREALSAGLGGRPVFMITGLKVARGFKRITTSSSSVGARANASAAITPDASIGGDTSIEHQKSFEEVTSTRQDIVFAYRLHTIAKKSWFKAAYTLKHHEPVGGMSSNQLMTLDDEDDEDIDINETSLGDLERSAELSEDLVVPHALADDLDPDETLCIEVQLLD